VVPEGDMIETSKEIETFYFFTRMLEEKLTQ
jgi:hypothetical protein